MLGVIVGTILIAVVVLCVLVLKAYYAGLADGEKNAHEVFSSIVEDLRHEVARAQREATHEREARKQTERELAQARTEAFAERQRSRRTEGAILGSVVGEVFADIADRITGTESGDCPVAKSKFLDDTVEDRDTPDPWSMRFT